MGDQHGAEAQVQLLRQLEPERFVGPVGEVTPQIEEGHKEQAEGDAGDDLRVDHGDVIHRHQRSAPALSHVVEADGGKGARDGGDDGCQDRDSQGGIQGVQDHLIVEQLVIPIQGEAGPYGAAFGVVEGKDNQNEDGGIKEEKDQSGHQAAEQRWFPIHSITACSSPSPKRFITVIQTTTTSIITRATAEPSWGL